MEPRPSGYCSVLHAGQPFPGLLLALLGGPVPVYTALKQIQSQCCVSCGEAQVPCDPSVCREAFVAAALRCRTAPSPVASFARTAQNVYREYHDREILGIGAGRENPEPTGAIADIVNELFG